MGEVAREQTLARVLAPVLDDYDIVLIDCQPSLGLLTVNALTAADGVIVPLECEFFALRGVALLMDTIDKVQERLNPRLELEGILATMYDARTLHGREVLARVVEAFGDKVFHTVISRTVRFPETTVAGRADHDVRVELGGRGRLPPAGPGGPGPRGRARGGPMSRRSTLPGADELFRAHRPLVGMAAATRERPTTAGRGPGRGAGGRRPRGSRPRAGRAAARWPAPTPPRAPPSGRQRHDEKITVYVSAEELLDLEQARLALRAHHGIAVDRGRIVREALAVVIADLEAKGEASILVRRLGLR